MLGTALLPEIYEVGAYEMYIKHILITIFAATAVLCLAESGIAIYLFYNSRAYPVHIVDLSRPDLEQKHKELLSSPSCGDGIALRVFFGTILVREIVGTIIASNRLVCTNGWEISYGEDSVIDLFRTLRKTDIIMQTPQFH
jgi:hypothetical protein